MKNIIDFINEGFRRGQEVTGTLPNGKKITGKYVDTYGANDKYTSIKTDDGKQYGVDSSTVERVAKPRAGQDPDILKAKNSAKIKELYRKRRQIELEMEDDLADLGDDMYDGNNRRVKYWGQQLDKIDKQIERLSK